ncbi:MAG: amidase [Pseudomonadota bacterium]
MKPLNELGARQAADLIASRKLTAAELTAACLKRIEARDHEVGAFAYIDHEAALAQARALDRAPSKGVLHGVPIGVKDIIDTVDMPTGWGSPIYAGRRSMWDASCVALCRAEGAVILGKTVTTEFAYFHPGKTANPHNLRHTPGGSSQGSAAAVADFMVPVAFGSQTAASVTRPAAFCGVIGYKASYGSFDLAGVMALAPSFDTLGFLIRELDDIALLRAALLRDDREPPAVGAASLRVGLARTAQWPKADPATRTAVASAADKLARSGARVEEVKLPDEFAELVATHQTIMAFDAARTHAFDYNVHRQQVSDKFAELVEAGRAGSFKAYRAAHARAAEARRKLGAIFDAFDVLLAPSAVGEAPEGLGATGDPLFSRMWTLLHVPSVTLPVAKGPKGLPIGVQLIGRFNHDNQLIGDAKWALARLSSEASDA